eukprot:scaffold3375_cov590-Pavlova_lutheri.AAC.1
MDGGRTFRSVGKETDLEGSGRSLFSSPVHRAESSRVEEHGMESKTSQGNLVEPKDKDKSPPTHTGHGGHRLTLDIGRWWSPPFSIPLPPSPVQTQWTRPRRTPTIHEQRPQPPLGTAGKAWRCGMAGLNEAGNHRNDPQRMDAAPREANVHGYPRTSRADKITLNAESKFYFPQFLLC